MSQLQRSRRRLQRTLRRAVGRWRPQVGILMYHRVYEAASDPWGLCVTPRHFAEQLAHLKAHYPVLRLNELPALLATGSLPRRAVVLTFDDGYVDNYMLALSQLEAAQIPATFFIPTAAIDSGVEFWWDELERLVLLAPERAGPENSGILFLPKLPDAPSWPLNSPEERRTAYFALHRRLQPLGVAERESIMAAIRRWARHDPGTRPASRPMMRGELLRLAANPWADLGAHTRTHPYLAAWPLAEQLAEIAGSCQDLQKWLGHPVTTFAYPYGSYNDDSLRAAAQAGLALAVTVEEKAVMPGDAPHRLGRFYIGDWDGPTFAARLSDMFQRQSARYG